MSDRLDLDCGRCGAAESNVHADGRSPLAADAYWVCINWRQDDEQGAVWLCPVCNLKLARFITGTRLVDEPVLGTVGPKAQLS